MLVRNWNAQNGIVNGSMVGDWGRLEDKVTVDKAEDVRCNVWLVNH